MPTYPDPAVLFPEVAAAGSLAAALRAAVAEQGLTVPVPLGDAGSIHHALVPTTVPHRQGLVVSASHVERRWFIRGCDRAQNLALIEGDTQDLAQVARAAQAWHDGTSLADIPQLASFVELTGRFEVPDQDPARMVESEWQHLRHKAAGVNWHRYQALVEAAYAEPKLRALYPFTSHFTLRFATRTRPSLSHDIPVCVTGFHVTMGLMGQSLGEPATAEEAVALTVRHLPADLYPVTYGASDQG